MALESSVRSITTEVSLDDQDSMCFVGADAVTRLQSMDKF